MTVWTEQQIGYAHLLRATSHNFRACICDSLSLSASAMVKVMVPDSDSMLKSQTQNTCC